MHARSNPRRRRTRGTSLVEALGAMGFIGVAVIGFAMNSVTLTRANKTAAAVTAATALAQQKLEELRSLPLGAAQLTPGSYVDGVNPMQEDGTAGGLFRRSWTVSANDQPRAGIRTVTVTVAWTDSRPHTTRVAAFVRCSQIPCP